MGLRHGSAAHRDAASRPPRYPAAVRWRHALPVAVRWARRMNASRRWLERFLRRPLDARDVAARLGMLGAPVDAIEQVGADLSAFVVGLVTEVAPHPDADKLRVTPVDDGSGTLHTVVCGAPNVTAGHRY